MSRTFSMALAVLCCSAVAGLAQAQGPGGGMRANLDANGDGVVSAAEFDQTALARFQRMDENHDGVIDAAEVAALKARMEERRGPGGLGRPDMLAEMDADHDGKITQAEALAVSQARFARFDVNHDGKLDEAEQEAMRPKRPE
jgi:hypothetical protein